MSTIDLPASHREELSSLVKLADRRFAIVTVVITLGAPLIAYVSGIVWLLFYVHIALAAFWFGFDFFFKFVLGPALDRSPDDAAGVVNHFLVPKMVVVAEPLSLGVIGSGIGLAYLMGYWAEPSIWLWAALGIGALMLLTGFGPLHLITTRMVVELNADAANGDRLDELFGKAMQWGPLQTVFMLAIPVTMVGLRGLL